MTSEPLPAASLPTAMQDVDLRSLEGDYRSLSDLRGRRLLLLFIQPDCPHSRAILPVVAGLHPDPPAHIPAPIVITAGQEAENQHLVERYGLRCPVFIQDDVEVASAFRVNETPACCLVDERGQVDDVVHTGAVNVLLQAGVMPGPHWGFSTTEYRTAGSRYYEQVLPRVRGALRHQRYDPLDPATLDEESRPLVSVVMATRDRPGLLPIALECYSRQTYPLRELIVIDDGTVPADEQAVITHGGRLIRMPEGTPLGVKLNQGVRSMHGALCQIWDDDDWYAPTFLEVLVAHYRLQNAAVCRPTVAFQMRRLWLDLESWRVLTWPNEDPSGGTLLFARSEWEERPFREIRSCVDYWFLLDHIWAGAWPAPVENPELYLYVRHDPSTGDRPNIWNRWADGQELEQYLRAQGGESRSPADLLPDWALAAYSQVRSRRGAMSQDPAERRSVPYQTPRTDTEQTLQRIWETVLRVDGIGVHDELADLGADSLLNLEIVLTAEEAGLPLTLENLYLHKTIASLSEAIDMLGEAPASTAEPLAGPVPLSSNQEWLLGQGDLTPDWAVLTTVMEVDGVLDIQLLERAKGQLMLHHDALRLQCRKTGDRWQAEYLERAHPDLIPIFDLSTLEAGDRQTHVEEALAQVKGSVDIEHGRVVRFGLVRLENDRSLLLLAIHHVVSDTLSIAILVRDLASLYAQLAHGEQPRLPARTASIVAMQKKAEELAELGDLRKTALYWVDTAAHERTGLTIDFPEQPGVTGREGIVEAWLHEEQTAMLQALRRLGLSVCDAVHYALARALSEEVGSPTVQFRTMSHGRGPLPGIDLTRTVGFLARDFPLVLEVGEGVDHLEGARATRARIQAIPYHGLSFRILIDHADHTLRRVLRSGRAAPIRLNYEGELYRILRGGGLFHRTTAWESPPVPGDAEPEHLPWHDNLEITASIEGTRLLLWLTYHNRAYRRETVERFAGRMIAILTDLATSATPDQVSNNGLRRAAVQAETPTKPKLLFQTPVMPRFTGSGMNMRCAMIVQALVQRYDVYLMVIPVDAPPPGPASEIATTVCRAWTIVDPFPGGSSEPDDRDIVSEDVLCKVAAQFLDVRFDVIHTFHLCLAPYAAPYLSATEPALGSAERRPRRHLDLDNIESRTCRRIADRYRANGREDMAEKEEQVARRYTALEARILPGCDRVYVCSEHDKEDLETLHGLKNVEVLPNCVMMPPMLPPKPREDPFMFLFVGTLEYYPNEDALLFLIHEILPILRRKAARPFRVVIAGSGVVPSSIRAMHEIPEVDLVGSVPRMEPYYQRTDAVLAPIRAGGGTRIKILESMSYWRPVVSTTMGIEGLDVADDEHVLVADTAEAVADQCLRLMTHPALAQRLTENAFELCQTKYSPAAVAAALDSVADVATGKPG